ncbi:MAG: hypothetical protein GY748_16070 [Planctomycetaceae bacterium]|nr:hypothetical protein [Planctomycetaceae bacterium]
MARDNFASLKTRIRLSDHIRKKVKLKHEGADWFGRCPFHDEKTASFSVNDKKGFYHCFGCQQHGDILDWWQKQEGLSFSEACNRLREEAGASTVNMRREISTKRQAKPDVNTERKQNEAQAIWEQSTTVSGTPAETYFQSRCIELNIFSDALRFHPGLQPDMRKPETFPVLIAGVTNSKSNIVAIQRTFLARDGKGKAAISTPKRSLGPVSLGCVKLGAELSILGVAEGVETGLSAMELFRVPVWCALGSNLSRIELPQIARNVVIFGDRGRAGEEATAKARQMFKSQGRKVAVRFPQIGDDFNDELRVRRDGK